MINQVVMQGNAGSDPELKFVKDNLAIGIVSIAHTPRTQKAGKWEDGETVWIRVVQFGEKAEALMDLVKKGDSVIVTGAIKLTTYKSRDGQEKTALEINAQSISVMARPSNKRKEDLPSW